MKILVVDDNVDLAKTLGLMLECMGHEAVLAFCGIQAITVAQAEGPEVILMDIGLPDITGYEACQRLRALPAMQSVLIVAQTGRDDASDRGSACDAGFDHLLVKPAPYEAIERLLSSHATSLTLEEAIPNWPVLKA